MAKTDILVLRRHIFGRDASEYADALRERMPDTEIVFPQTLSEERTHLQKAKVVTGPSLNEQDLSIADELELFAYTFAGTDYLDLELFEEYDVRVTNASGIPAANIAEYVIGAMIAGARDFPRAWRHQQQNTYRSFHTKDVAGSTIAVIGLGSIGKAIVQRLEGFEVNTIGVRYTPSKGGPTDEIHGFENVKDVAARSDFVILACPLTDQTEGLIDDEVLGVMKPESILVNVSRGAVVDTEALTKRLQRNHIGYAILDVTDPEPLPSDHPLWDLDNVFLTAHHAGDTPSYYDRLANLIKTNYESLPDGELTNEVHSDCW